MTQLQVLEIVGRMCNTQSTDCRSLNKRKDARLLMDIFKIPETAKIREIPLDWDNQILITFEMPNDNNRYCLFAGIGSDKKYYCEISREGKRDELIILQDDYFQKAND